MLSRPLARWRRSLAVALVPAAALLSAGAGREAHGGPVAGALATAAAPLQAGVAASTTWLGSLVGGSSLRRENEELRREVEQLRREVQESRERLSAAGRLERLLEYRERTGYALTAASVVGHDASGLYRTVLIDRGAADGIGHDQAVLAPEGVVGRVVKVFPRSALVLLLTDRSSGIDALVQRTRDQGVVQGRGDAGCELRYLDRSAEVRVGDVIVTSGMGGRFPKGVWVGEVSDVTAGGELFQSVAVRPTADLARLEEVLVMGGERP